MLLNGYLHQQSNSYQIKWHSLSASDPKQKAVKQGKRVAKKYLASNYNFIKPEHKKIATFVNYNGQYQYIS